MNTRIDYPCYHSAIQYSADACDGCKYEMDCYRHFLKNMMARKETSK